MLNFVEIISSGSNYLFMRGKYAFIRLGEMSTGWHTYSAAIIWARSPIELASHAYFIVFQAKLLLFLIKLYLWFYETQNICIHNWSRAESISSFSVHICIYNNYMYNAIILLVGCSACSFDKFSLKNFIIFLSFIRSLHHIQKHLIIYRV